MVAEEKSTSGEGENQQGFPPPISDAKRKRLQQCFEHANMQMRQQAYDYATDLFTQCVLGDPANPAYVQGFLSNLKQKYNNNKKGSNLAFLKTAGPKTLTKKCQAQKDWTGVFKNGIEVLKLNPWDVGTLTALAHALTEANCQSESELHFLKQAQECDPKDPGINKLCAIALKARRRYAEAIVCWRRVQEAKPNDEEANRAIASLAVEQTIDQGKYTAEDAKAAGKHGHVDGAELTPEQRIEREIRRNPKDIPKYIELAELYIHEELFKKAAEVYKRALQIDKTSLDLLEKLEDVDMRELRRIEAEAKEQAAKTNSPADRQRAEQATRHVAEMELDLYKKRVERYPNNLQYRYQLAERYKVMGLYNEAIAEYQVAVNDPKYRGLCLLSLGQCFQKIKKYQLAMTNYEQAIEQIADRDADNKKKALYLAGKLAVGMKDYATGLRYLNALAGQDFNYKDVSTLLDKLAELGNNDGSD